MEAQRSSSSPPNNAADDNENKAQTNAAITRPPPLNFRKRRLSLPKHHLEPVDNGGSLVDAVAAAASLVAAQDAGSDDDNEEEAVSFATSNVTPTPPSRALAQKQQQQQEDAMTNVAVQQQQQLEEADEKAHTFRKRRLSLTLAHTPQQQRHFHSDSKDMEEPDSPMLEIQSPPSADRKLAKQQPPDAEEEALERQSTTCSSEASSSAPPPNIENPPQLQRHLSGGGTSGDDDDCQDEAPDAKRQRRFSTASSVASSVSTAAGHHRPRILHSAEMLSGPLAPPSPIHHMVLHQQNPLPPSQTSALDAEKQQSHPAIQPSHSFEFSPTRLSSKKRQQRRRHSWKQRHFHTDEETLPFPMHLVGTYSCHGIEPIYDSDCDPNSPQPQQQAATEDDEDDGDGWSNEPNDEKKVPAESGGSATPANGKTMVQAAATPQAAISAKINQDRGGITFPYANSNRTALFAVYDGHGQGGELVSQFAVHEIQRRLEKHSHFHKDLPKALCETFCDVDEALKHESIIEPFFAGTTACVAVLQDRKLTLANAGDSRAVIARKRKDLEGDYDAIDLTVDQNPDSPKEMERILNSGGFVSPPPGPGLSARVWLDAEMTQIGLAMARSIGDHAVASVGVICEPVVTTHAVTERDDFMILASDGVWEFVSSQDAVQIVGDHLEELGATKACQALIEAAASKWHDEEGEYRDDITAIVVRLQNLWDNKSAEEATQNGSNSKKSQK